MMNLKHFYAHKPAFRDFFASIIIFVLCFTIFIGSSHALDKVADLELKLEKYSLEAFSDDASTPLDSLSKKRFESEFKHELLMAKVDFLLDKMMHVSRSSESTELDSQRFEYSGKILADHYDDLSAAQKNKLIQCLTI